MESHRFVITFKERSCRIRGQKGTLEALKVEEVLPNGKRTPVHTDIRFYAKTATPAFRDFLHLFKRRTNDTERRAA